MLNSVRSTSFTDVPPDRGAWLGRILIVLAVLGGYAGTLGVPFVFDDIAAITQNPSLRRIGDAFTPPPDLSVSGRPLVNVSLALNYALGGTTVAGYHAVNLALHLTTALLLFGLVRRVAPRLGVAANHHAFAAIVSAVWALHPLQTAAVTYVMQRSELLVSCSAMATIYTFVRSLDPALSRGQTVGWQAASVLACTAAMLAKEVAIAVPLLVLVVDRLLAATTGWFALLRRRRRYYGSLAATWIVLAALLLLTPGRGASAGLESGLSWISYARSQLAGLLTYGQLSLWPTPLIFDRGATLATASGTVLGGGILVLLLLGVATRGWTRWPLAAATVAWSLLLLAPSSSVVPIATQILGEHRLYLALVGPIFLGCWLLARATGGRHLTMIGGALAAALLLLTVGRNRDYRSLISIWADTVSKAPENARAHFNYGLALEVAGKSDDARAAYLACLSRAPDHREAQLHVARLYQRAGQPTLALPHFEAALQTMPEAAVHNETAVALLLLNRTEEAIGQFKFSLALSRDQPLVHYNLGLALQRLERWEEALAHLDAAAPFDEDARRAAARVRAFLRR